MYAIRSYYADGALLLAIIHEVIALGLYDREFLVRYTNAGQLVNLDEVSDDFGLMVRDPEAAGEKPEPIRSNGVLAAVLVS